MTLDAISELISAAGEIVRNERMKMIELQNVHDRLKGGRITEGQASELVATILAKYN